ncbi:MAG: tetratricopeptide repeat protein [Thermoanaerobaculia bacterium]
MRRGTAGAVLAILAIGSAGAQEEPPTPDLSALEPAVAEQITVLRTGVDSLEGTSAPAEELAAARGELGMAYHAYGMGDAARYWYAAAAAAAPEDARWSYYPARLAQQEGDLASAEEDLDLLATRSPDVPQVWARLGEVQLDRGEAAAAGESLARAFALSPHDPGISFLLGQVALSERRWADAVAHLERAQAGAPRADRIHYSLGLAYRGLGADELARQEMEKRGDVGVRFLDPWDDALTDMETGERLFLLRGRQAFAAGAYEDAAAAFRQAAEFAPESARARVNLGTALGTLGDTDGALAAYEEALEIDPRNVTAHYNVGQLLAGLGRWREALGHLRAAVEANPDDEDARLTEAEALLRSGDPIAAGARLSEAHDALPTSGRIAAAYARLLAAGPVLEERDGARALMLAQQVYQARPTPDSAHLVALALAELGHCEQALEWERKIVDAAREAGEAELEQRASAGLAAFSRDPCRPGTTP